MAEIASLERSLREELKPKLKDVTLETLPEFIEYALAGGAAGQHDYGSICVAMGAIAAAACWAANTHKNGGITGFQASAVTWEFIEAWGTHGEGPKRLVSYRDMLYPQYEPQFTDRKISSYTWEYLQDEARKMLQEDQGLMADEVRNHLRSIVDGVVPFGYTVRGDD